MVAFELLAQRIEASLFGARGYALFEEREEILFLVVVVAFRRLHEVAQDGLGGEARLRIDAIPHEMLVQALERVELPLDAAMAGEQHLERIVESYGRIEKARARVPFHPRATGARGKGCSMSHTMRSAITT
ncbi:MAG TPA: hypothetical protein VLH12_01430 [Usitatibacter sp.]|nr:hypothetical protein [Usitatibacter sp.]